MTPTRAISSLDWRGGGSPGGDLVLRRASVLDPRAGIDGVHDVVIRDGEIAELAEPGAGEGRRRGDRRRGQARLPGLLRPARPPPGPGRRGRGGHRDRHTRRRRGRLLRRPRDGEHEPARGYGRGCPCAPRAGGRARIRARRLPGLRVTRHGGRGADRDGRASRHGRGRVLRRRPADRQRPPDAPRTSVPAPGRRQRRPPRGGPRPLPPGGRACAAPRRRDARGRGVGGAGARGVAVGRGVHDDRPRRCARRLRGCADPRPAPVGPRVGGGGGGGKGGRRRASPARRRRTTWR